MNFSQIKTLSKNILSGNIKSYLPFILGGLFTVISFTCISYVITVFTQNPIVIISTLSALILIYFLLLSGFRSGSNAWFHFYTSKNKLRRSLFWFSPKKQLKSTILYFNIFLRKAIWSILLLLPGGVTVFSFVLLALDTGIEFNLFLCGVTAGGLMLLCGLIFRFLIVQKYFLASFFLIENPKIKTNHAIKKSINLMNGNLKKTALFKLSFIPWFSLSLSVLPLIYVLPYYKQSCLMYAKELKNRSIS